MQRGLDVQRDLVRRIRDVQLAAIQPISAARQRFAVHAQRHQFDRVAEQHDLVAAAVRIAPHGQAGGDPGQRGIEVARA